jgi:hypothetical protein
MCNLDTLMALQELASVQYILLPCCSLDKWACPVKLTDISKSDMELKATLLMFTQSKQPFHAPFPPFTRDPYSCIFQPTATHEPA